MKNCAYAVGEEGTVAIGFSGARHRHTKRRLADALGDVPAVVVSPRHKTRLMKLQTMRLARVGVVYFERDGHRCAGGRQRGCGGGHTQQARTSQRLHRRHGRAAEPAYRDCDKDDNVRAIVVTGAGRAFCAGADFSGSASPFDSPTDDIAFSASPIDPAAFELRKPVIAALNGHAIGIGLTIALQADIRIVAEDAKYGVVQVRRGVIPDCMSHWTLAQLTNLGVAAEVLLTGRTFDGAEAVAFGIANKALPAGRYSTTRWRWPATSRPMWRRCRRHCASDCCGTARSTATRRDRSRRWKPSCTIA